VLDAKIERWIKAQQTAPPTSTTPAVSASPGTPAQ
jgi:hypothetical protein